MTVHWWGGWRRWRSSSAPVAAPVRTVASGGVKAEKPFPFCPYSSLTRACASLFKRKICLNIYIHYYYFFLPWPVCNVWKPAVCCVLLLWPPCVCPSETATGEGRGQRQAGEGRGRCDESAASLFCKQAERKTNATITRRNKNRLVPLQSWRTARATQRRRSHPDAVPSIIVIIF